MNTLRCLKVLPALALLAACATTLMTSVRDPAFHGRTFQRIVVVAPFTDLEKKATADSFVAALQAQGAQAMPGMTVLPPTRTSTDEDISAAFRADGVLMLALTDASVSSTASGREWTRTDPSGPAAWHLIGTSRTVRAYRFAEVARRWG